MLSLIETHPVVLFLVATIGVLSGQLLFQVVRPWLGRLLSRRQIDRHLTVFALPSPEEAISRIRAQERRKVIQELSRPSETWRSRFLISYEFLEQPPESLKTNINEFSIESADAIAQAVRLDWQIKSDELLLAERVVDAIITLRRTLLTQEDWGDEPLFSGEFETYPTVKLIYEQHLEEFGLFPWTVLIETQFASFYSRRLRNFGDWLGIGIRFGRPSRAHMYGKCKMGSGSKGKVGGILQGSTGSYGMTCAHVLSAECGSVVCTLNPSSGDDQPDAALINTASGCFSTPSHPKLCIAASEADVRKALIDKEPVRKGQSSNKHGYLSCRVHEIPIDGKSFRFPHVQIVPPTIPLLGRFSSALVSAFSQEGDSGTWVFNDETSHWLGMVVAGDPDRELSYAIEPEPLLEYFRLRLNDPDLKPYE